MAPQGMLNWLKGRKAGTATPPAAPSATPPPDPPAARRDPDELMREAFALDEAGDLAAAERLYREILALDPNYGDAHFLLGVVERRRGRNAEALPHLRSAVRADARNAHFQRSLGDVLQALGQHHDALAPYQAAAELEPDNYEHWNNLGAACERLGRLEEASRHFERALALAPDSPAVMNNIAKTLRERGRLDEATAYYRKLRELAPDNAMFFSNYLLTLIANPAHAAEQVWREHAAFDEYFGTGRHGARAAPATDRDPDRRLRVGYLSPDFRAHPVAFFLEAVLAHHDPAAVAVTGYTLDARPDEVTARLRALCDDWVDCAGAAPEAVAQRIAQDRIDVLVDLAGHTGNNGLPVLGYRPAPVIATWLGYGNTTGLRTVDYRITDGVCDPPGAERYHTEQVWRLDGAQWCYTRPAQDAAVTPLPAAGDGHLRFGSYNHASKINDETLRVWARILERIPNSSLLVWGVIGEQAAHIRGVMRAAGADPSRLDFSARTPFAEQLALLQRTDIALDTYPYCGVTTTFNALWMGVPVLSRYGPASVSRTTLSICRTLDLADWCVDTADAMVEAAARKAADIPALGRLRAGLRSRLEASALMDGPAFARKLEAAYREMWRAYCRAPVA